jgi:hypothetical protein
MALALLTFYPSIHMAIYIWLGLGRGLRRQGVEKRRDGDYAGAITEMSLLYVGKEKALCQSNLLCPLILQNKYVSEK